MLVKRNMLKKIRKSLLNLKKDKGILRSTAPARSPIQLEQLEPRVLLSLSVTDLSSLTAHQLAQSLVGTGVTISNASFTGADVAAGSFDGGLSEGLGIASGVILSTGDIVTAIGPNNR